MQAMTIKYFRYSIRVLALMRYFKLPLKGSSCLLLTWKLGAWLNFFVRPDAVFSSMLRWRIGTGSHQFLRATSTCLGAFCVRFPRCVASINCYVRIEW